MTTIKVGNTVVKIYHCNEKGRYDQFKVVYRIDGKRKIETFGKLKKAKNRAMEIAVKIENGERDALKLTNVDRSTYLRAIELLKPTGVPLHVAIEEYLTLRKPAECPEKLVPDVIAQLLEDKKAHGASRRHIQTLRRQLNRFAEAFDYNIGSITARVIEQWLASLKVGPRSRNNYRASVVTLFRYARKHGYLPRERETEADLVDKVKERGGEIGILSPKELAELLSKANDEAALFMSLGAFSGIRTAELLRLEWSDINFERGHIIVGKHKFKTATRRLVPISANLMQWLSVYRKETGRIFAGNHTPDRVIAFAKQHVEWKSNCLRYSYASYRLAGTQDGPKVALEMGNSPAMLFRNYRELADEHDAKAWFAISPKRSRKIVDVQFSARA